MAIKTLRVFAEYTSTGFVPMPTAGGIDYGYTLASTFPSTTPSSFQTDDPDIDVTVTAMTDFYVWIRINGTAWNPSYTRNVRVYPDSPDINSVVMNMIIATGPAGVSSYSQIVQTANRLYFNGATTDSVYDSKFAGKTLVNELHWTTAPQLATVATSGAYADLTGKPALATVATSGSYADLSSKPSGTAPLSYNSGTNSFEITQASATTNGYLSSANWTTFNNKYTLPTGGTTAQYLNGLGALTTFPTTLDSKRLIMTVRNETGTTLTKGTVVYINGVAGNTPLAAKALATQDSTSAQTLGVLDADINNNQSGNVILVGQVTGLDTSSYTEGVQLYLSGTTAGTYTSTKTLAPTHLVYVGIVTRAHATQGVIEVKIQNGYELDEIHDVQISSPANKDILYRDSATSLWKHASIASVLGYTPYNGTDATIRGLFSATTPLSYNSTTGAFSISQANGTTNGYLSSADWTTFNSKQSALTLGNVSEVSSNVLMFPDGGTGKTIGNLTIQVVQAGATTNGYLSSTDWSTFNNKLGTITLTTTGTSGAATYSAGTLNIPQYQGVLTNPVTGTGTTGHVAYWNGSGTLTGSVNHFWDNTNGRLGIGTSSPSTSLDVVGAGKFSTTLTSSGLVTLTSGGNASLLMKDTSSANKWEMGYEATTNNFYIYSYSGSISPFRITPSGNVGIGTISPPSDVKLSARATSSSGYNLLIEQDNGLDGFILASTSAHGALTFSRRDTSGTNTTERFRITAGGSVGVGITTPNHPLTVKADTSANGINIVSESGGYGQLSFSNAANSTVNTAITQVPNGSNYDMYLSTFNGSSRVTRMVINGTGNVGIGTSSPQERFEVNAPFGNIRLYGRSGVTENGISSNVYYNGSSWVRDNISYGSSAIRFASDGTIVINNDASTSGFPAERMRIAPGGNVGIGTYSPLKVLHLSVNGNNSGILWTYNPGGDYRNEINNVFDGGSSSGNRMQFKVSNSSTTGQNNVMNLCGNGNVLIGTPDDYGYKLFVSGTIYATSNITANSDLTLKKNLQLIDNPIDKLMSLNGYLYQWKENDEYQYGVIAQEVEKVMSYAVSTGNNGVKGVAYNQLTPLLIEGFKLHNSEITQLKERVKYLEAKLA